MHDIIGQCGCHHGKSWYKLIGRVLLGAIFLIAGWAKLTGFAGAEAMIAQGGFPSPALFTVLAIIFELGGALLIISGFHARTGAWALIIFTAIATLAYHNPSDGQIALIMFEKNLAIIGGLLYIVATGAGKYSLAKWNRAMCKGGNMCADCSACDQHDMPKTM